MRIRFNNDKKKIIMDEQLNNSIKDIEKALSTANSISFPSGVGFSTAISNLESVKRDLYKFRDWINKCNDIYSRSIDNHIIDVNKIPNNNILNRNNKVNL